MGVGMRKLDAVSNMVAELEKYAESKGVSLKGNIPDDVNDFDDLFQDGGEGRCEHFVDLSFEYAIKFGEIDDWKKPRGFEAHVWSCIESAMKKLTKKHGAKEEDGS
jgi:hypothetical protein